MEPIDPPTSRHRSTAGSAGHAAAVAALLDAPYTPGDQTITAQLASITVLVDVRRDPFQFAVPAAQAAEFAELLATNRPSDPPSPPAAEPAAADPAAEEQEWEALGRAAFDSGVLHPSPLSNPDVAQRILAADPDDVHKLVAFYGQGWNNASEDRGRAQMPYSIVAPNQPPPPSTPAYFVWDSAHNEVGAVLPDGTDAKPGYKIRTASGRERAVHRLWIEQQPPATAEQRAALHIQMTAIGYRLEVVKSLSF
ncbi:MULTISPECIES: hypothetical protein [Nocardia]|uniref:hypothetical protein n=1 Tax=Nocardia TaxID=1817 RepID=UPI000D691FB2|nr:MULTISPECIES: hypothetical protein [Nocardia]